MNGDNLDLAAELKEIAEDPAPPTTLDIDRARRIGGRRRRLRTASIIAGCAVVVLGIGIAVPSLVGRENTTQDKAATPPAPEIDTRQSPLVAKASFGWLPDSIPDIGYGLGSEGDYTVAKGVVGEFPPMVWLSAHDREPRVESPMGKMVKIPTTVNGGKAHWLTTDERDPLNGGDIYLRWQAGNGKWAQIHAYYMDFPDLQQLVRKIAEDVVVEDRAVPLPLRISSLPENFLNLDMSLNRPAILSNSAWEVLLRYTVNGADVAIEVHPQGARALTGSVCTTANGLDACVLVNLPKAAGLDEIGGARGLLDRITLLGTDESKWTTRVVG